MPEETTLQAGSGADEGDEAGCVTSVRSRTAAKVHSIGFVVLRRIQCELE
ncbi:hypothetical protein [Streptomyces sp. NPDC001165]